MQEILLSIITLLGGALVYFLKQTTDYWLEKKKAEDLERAAYQYLLDAVVKTNECLVDKIKTAKGNLTPGEVEEAKNDAYQKALTYASGKVKDFLTNLSKERLDSMIRLAVVQISKGGKT